MTAEQARFPGSPTIRVDGRDVDPSYVDPGEYTPGTITVFCIVAPKSPSSHNEPSGEGATVVVPSIVNFNHTGGDDNIFVQTS